MSDLTSTPFSMMGRMFESPVLLNEPTEERGNCAGCGNSLPQGMKRYRYNLCTPCLVPGRFTSRDEATVKKRSFKSKVKKR